MSLTEEIKNKVTVLDLVSEFVDLKKQGRLFKSVCPFHSENTPSFIVDPDKNMWRCFGACSTGGDVISFIMKKDSISFLDSLNFLKNKLGITTENFNSQKFKEIEEIKKINMLSAEFFKTSLFSTSGENVRNYLKNRGISKQSAIDFDLGYNPPGNKLSDYFNNKGYTKGATYLVNNRDKKAIQALEEPNCKLLILSAGYNDLSKLRVKGKGPDKNKYFYKKETIVNQIKDSFKTIIEKAHSYKPPKKIVLFLINRKKPSKHSRENEATKEINRWLIEESNADVIVNPRNLEIKNNKKHFRDAAHFTPECEDEIFKALQKHLIKTKETPSSSTNYKGKTPIKTPAGYKRVANAPQEIQEQAVVLLKAILKDPNHENQIGKTQKTVKDKNGREWLLVADVHGANEFNKKAHLGISAFPKKT